MHKGREVAGSSLYLYVYHMKALSRSVSVSAV